MQPDDPASLLILELAKHLGVPPVSVTLYLPFLVLAANRVAHLIPDDATGPLKWLRVGLSVLGFKVSNRETSKKAEPEGTRERSEVGDEGLYPLDDGSEDEVQGAFALDDVREMQIPQMFRSGAARMNSNQKED